MSDIKQIKKSSIPCSDCLKNKFYVGQFSTSGTSYLDYLVTIKWCIANTCACITCNDKPDNEGVTLSWQNTTILFVLTWMSNVKRSHLWMSPCARCTVYWFKTPHNWNVFSPNQLRSVMHQGAFQQSVRIKAHGLQRTQVTCAKKMRKLRSVGSIYGYLEWQKPGQSVV